MLERMMKLRKSTTNADERGSAHWAKLDARRGVKGNQHDRHVHDLCGCLFVFNNYLSSSVREYGRVGPKEV